MTHNYDVSSGVVNGAEAIVKQVRYELDETTGNRIATSCVVELKNVTDGSFTGDDRLPHLREREVVALQESVDIKIKHPHSRKTMSFKRRQLPILPAFAVTDYKAQGKTLQRAILDLHSCRGIQSAYVMVSRVTSLSGVAILRPFSPSKINSHLNEDLRTEMKRLHAMAGVPYCDGSSVDMRSPETVCEAPLQDVFASLIDHPPTGQTSTADNLSQFDVFSLIDRGHSDLPQVEHPVTHSVHPNPSLYQDVFALYNVSSSAHSPQAVGHRSSASPKTFLSPPSILASQHTFDISSTSTSPSDPSIEGASLDGFTPSALDVANAVGDHSYRSTSSGYMDCGPTSGLDIDFDGAPLCGLLAPIPTHLLTSATRKRFLDRPTCAPSKKPRCS